ncbi:MAG: MBOAT family O-acyltransferase [Agathobacter sp.]|nr:MBOAT family O-acyltransferase [Agathobacter sp.]
MVFSSFVFLLVFLPLVLAIYYICPDKLRNLVLFIASLIFYAWGEPVYVLIMLFSTVFDYTNGRLIENFQNKKNDKMAKTVLVIDLVGNLCILGFFKYTDFAIGTVNSIFGTGISLLHIALPIGISFYTFQTMSYTIDVYKGVVPAQKNILNFGTYVVLFPQLIAGPIVQYKTIGQELESRKVGVNDFADGAYRFTMGLAKKVIFSNQIGALWNTIAVTGELTTATAWLGAFAFTLHIYFDFSGYSDMAIGLGRMFGFHFLENFDHPYMSKSITEFWRRWHISLGSWFREYVYIPLGGNRHGLAKQIRNLLIVWMLTGLWHGASWNFVAWGLYYGILLIIEKLFLLKKMEKWPGVIKHIYTMVIVVFGWFIFAIPDIAKPVEYLKAMFGIGVSGINGDFWYYVSTNIVLIIILIICSIDHKSWLTKNKYLNRVYRWYNGWTIDNGGKTGSAVAKTIVMVMVLLISFAFLVGGSYNPFLYFRF